MQKVAEKNPFKEEKPIITKSKNAKQKFHPSQGIIWLGLTKPYAFQSTLTLNLMIEDKIYDCNHHNQVFIFYYSFCLFGWAIR